MSDNSDFTIYMNNTLDCTFPVKVPATAEVFDRIAGPGACVKEAVRNVIYRSVNHEFRSKLCERLETETGIPREHEMVGEGDKARREYTETEKKYIARLKLNGHIDQERIQALANEIANEIEFDPTPSQRRGGPSKEIVNAADNIFAALEAGQTTPETVASKIAARLGIADFIGTYGEFTKDTVILALVAIDEKEKRERVSSLI